MIYIDELKNLKMYNRKFCLPINPKDRLKGKSVMLLTPNIKSSIGLMNNRFITPRFYSSYYMEKNVSYLISNEATLIEKDSEEYSHISVGPINEGMFPAEKQLIFNGYNSDISVAKRYLTIDLIENINSKYFMAKLDYPISVTVLRVNRYYDTNKGNINISSFDFFDNDEKRYMDHCIKNVIEMIIKTLNSDAPKPIIMACQLLITGKYPSGENTYDKYGIGGVCRGILGLWNEPNGYKKFSNMIKDNDYSKIISSSVKQLVNKYKDEIKAMLESEKMDDYDRMRRNITTNLRKGSNHILNHVSDAIEDHIDTSTPIDPTPISKKSEIPSVDTTSGTEEKKDEEVEEVVSLAYSTEFDYVTESINEEYMYLNNAITFFDEATDKTSDIKLRNLLYKDRIRTSKELIHIYDSIMAGVPYIDKTFLRYERYKRFNLIIDLHYYNNLFFEGYNLQADKGVELYRKLLNRMINDKKIKSAGYDNSIVLIPISDWDDNPNTKMWYYREDINPVSMFYRFLQSDLQGMQAMFKDTHFVFIGQNGYFKMQFSDIRETDSIKFLNLVKKLRTKSPVEQDIDDPNPTSDSPAVITDEILSNIEKKTSVTMHRLVGDGPSVKVDAEVTKPTKVLTQKEIDEKIKDDAKKEVVSKIEKVAANSSTTDEAIETLDSDAEFKKLLLSITSDADEGIKINNARLARINDLNDKFINKTINGKSVKELIDTSDSYSDEKIPTLELKVDSVNPEWKSLTYENISNVYDIDSDIMNIIYSLTKMSYPISIRSIETTDNSTSEDFINTYTIECESHVGKRFTLKFDVPIMINNQYMKLRGNNKSIATQSTLCPILKTEEDTVQIVSNYKKIFFYVYGTTAGKTNCYTDRIMKALAKNQFKDISIVYGDNSKICARYDLPIDYIDFANVYSKIILKDCTIYFNQFELRENYKVDDSKGLPIGVDNAENILYYSISENYPTFSIYLLYMLMGSTQEFSDAYNSTNESVRYMYSRAKVMNVEIPVAVVAGYHVGTTKMLDIAGVQYEILPKKPIKSKADPMCSYIKFSDGVIAYKNTYSSSMLMNGLKECPTEEFSLAEMNSKRMYISFLDQFGGRIKADGLDNFYDCMIDPITKKILESYKLPTDYVELLIYASQLLTDNKYSANGNMMVRRLRRNELIAGYVYRALSESYGSYSTQLKHGRDITMTIKQTAVLDLILSDNTVGDVSIINLLNEKESYNAVSSKGLSGMNSVFSYSLDKRGYDDSMVNVLSMSTGFAGNVGISRQSTINANVDTVRGFIKESKPEDMNPVNSLCMTEALSPFMSTRDDPFRTAMTFVQTSKHTVRCDKYTPTLITTGADQALPLLTSDIFSFKAKDDGEVIELNDDYMLISYKNGKKDYIDLRDKAEKNSSTGIYVSLKLDTDLKVGSKFKKMDIVAYDKKSLESSAGFSNNKSYVFAALAKAAIMDTDEGFEDSAIVTEALSEALSTTIIKDKSVTIPKNTNIYNVVKKGQEIREGDPLMIMQTPFDEEDATKLLSNLVKDGDDVSSLGKIPIKSKVTGYIHDIKIYRTVELDELSPSLRKLCEDYERNIRKVRKTLTDNGIKNTNKYLDADYKLEPTGKLKDAADGVKIIFYMRYRDKYGIGDKLIYTNANKGVDKDIIPLGDEPYSLDRPDEKIHTLCSIASLNGRMVTSVSNVGVLNRLLIEEARAIKDIAGIKYDENIL